MVLSHHPTPPTITHQARHVARLVSWQGASGSSQGRGPLLRPLACPEPTQRKTCVGRAMVAMLWGAV